MCSWSVVTTSSPGPRSRPLATTFMASVVFRGTTNPSASPPSAAASEALSSSQEIRGGKVAATWRVCSTTASTTTRGWGPRVPLFR